MIEDVRMDCARRVAEAEAGRQTAEAEVAQLRRALRNAVDELQRAVMEVRTQEASRETHTCTPHAMSSALSIYICMCARLAEAL
jgi:hypothetical protein